MDFSYIQGLYFLDWYDKSDKYDKSELVAFVLNLEGTIAHLKQYYMIF